MCLRALERFRSLCITEDILVIRHGTHPARTKPKAKLNTNEANPNPTQPKPSTKQARTQTQTHNNQAAQSNQASQTPNQPSPAHTQTQNQPKPNHTQTQTQTNSTKQPSAEATPTQPNSAQRHTSDIQGSPHTQTFRTQYHRHTFVTICVPAPIGALVSLAHDMTGASTAGLRQEFGSVHLSDVMTALAVDTGVATPHITRRVERPSMSPRRPLSMAKA